MPRSWAYFSSLSILINQNLRTGWPHASHPVAIRLHSHENWRSALRQSMIPCTVDDFRQLALQQIQRTHGAAARPQPTRCSGAPAYKPLHPRCATRPAGHATRSSWHSSTTSSTSRQNACKAVLPARRCVSGKSESCNKNSSRFCGDPHNVGRASLWIGHPRMGFQWRRSAKPFWRCCAALPYCLYCLRPHAWVRRAALGFVSDAKWGLALRTSAQRLRKARQPYPTIRRQRSGRWRITSPPLLVQLAQNGLAAQLQSAQLQPRSGRAVVEASGARQQQHAAGAANLLRIITDHSPPVSPAAICASLMRYLASASLRQVDDLLPVQRHITARSWSAARRFPRCRRTSPGCGCRVR